MRHMPGDSRDSLTSIAALEDPVRRTLYQHVARNADGVNRDQAAGFAGISRSLAAYHLDRLAEVGLLDVEYRRPPGRSGPGAGRPAKVYRRSSHPVQVSMPPRNYELLAGLLATTADPSGTSAPPHALTEAARQLGTGVGGDARERCGQRPSRRRLLGALENELDARGFEPEHDGKVVRLRNCPFEALARSHQNLVCGMNLALVEGMLAGLGAGGVSAVLDPEPGHCCVVVALGG